MNKYTSYISKGCVAGVDLEYPKELNELQNYYPLAPDKIKIKREMLSEYQRLLIYRIVLLVMLIKLGPNFLDKEKSVLPYENLQTYLKLGLKIKKSIAC